MRKAILLLLALTAAAVALTSAPGTAAARPRPDPCFWTCGPCGTLVCSCEFCDFEGPFPVCAPCPGDPEP